VAVGRGATAVWAVKPEARAKNTVPSSGARFATTWSRLQEHRGAVNRVLPAGETEIKLFSFFGPNLPYSVKSKSAYSEFYSNSEEQR
jgi:hypothetical protein